MSGSLLQLVKPRNHFLLATSVASESSSTFQYTCGLKTTGCSLCSEVAQQISGQLVPGKRFPDLLHHPLLSGMFRYLEMQHAASGVREHDEDEQNLERRGQYRKEVDRGPSALYGWRGMCANSAKEACAAVAYIWRRSMAPPGSPT